MRTSRNPAAAASSTAVSTAAIGLSSWRSATLAARNNFFARRTSTGLNLSFAPDATPYTDAEGVAAALREAGAPVEVQVLDYRTGTADRAVAEGFLQRCAFDDTVTLDQMEDSEVLGAYLAGCRGPDGTYEFTHEAHLITWQQP